MFLYNKLLAKAGDLLYKINMKIDMNNLPKDPVLLARMVTHLANQNDELTLKVSLLEEELALLKRKRYSFSSEKLSALEKEKLDKKIDELEQSIEDIALAKKATEKDVKDGSSNNENRGKGKRQPLPKNLIREETVLNPDPICPECKGDKFRKISDDITEVLDYVPGHFKVIRTVRPRCACVNCEAIVQATPPTRVLNKSIVGPGLLAHIMINKFCNSLPIYRQVQMFENEQGIKLERSTMTGWVGRAAVELSVLVDKIKEEILSSSHIHTDDTIIKVLAPGKGKTKTGRLWTYVRNGKYHGDTATAPAICYFYSPDRSAERPKDHLKDFKGVLHADAYPGYNEIFKNKKVSEAACWAHVRRKFYEAAVVAKISDLASHALKQISLLYEIEATIRSKPPEIREKVRKKKSLPIIKELIVWMKKSHPKLPKSSATAKAIQYALNLEVALKKYTADGKVEIDNNIAERAMRIVAIGRKNYLFAGSDAGGEFAANIYTLTETAKANNINPHAYMSQVLSSLQDYKANKIHELLPWNIKLEKQFVD